MLFTDYFPELEGKIPYIDFFDGLFCSFEEKESIKCTDEFLGQGFIKNSVCDLGAEYKYKCSSCPHFHHEIGFYFGDGLYSKDFEQKDTFYINARTTRELDEVVKHMPRAKKVYLVHGKKFDLAPIEQLSELESIQLALGTRDILWDISKTEKLRMLEIWVGIRPPTLDRLVTAENVEYLSIHTIETQNASTVLSSFDFFEGMINLKYLVLWGVTNGQKSMAALMKLPKLERLWISPNIFETSEYAEFEAKRFMIFDEYGVFEKFGFEFPLGIGRRKFRNRRSKEKFLTEYTALMDKYN